MSDEAPTCTSYEAQTRHVSSQRGGVISVPPSPDVLQYDVRSTPSGSKTLRLASLFSGGKDSAYAAYVAQQMGHTISCLISIHPNSEESMLLHHPNIRWTRLQAQAMRNAGCRMPVVSDTAESDDPRAELDTLESLLHRAVSKYRIQGAVHGGIRSEYQRGMFAGACDALRLQVVSPLWRREPAEQYMQRLIDCGFDVIITAVSAGGLDDSWLGRHITRDALRDLRKLSERHGFALDFEGGEAETFVLDCPLFERPIQIFDHRTTWDGYRGIFEILDAGIRHNA